MTPQCHNVYPMRLQERMISKSVLSDLTSEHSPGPSVSPHMISRVITKGYPLKSHRQVLIHTFPSRSTLHHHLLAHPNPAPNPAPNPPLLPSLTGLFATFPCPLTPSTTLSNCVSITTPPTIISDSVACSVSKLKIKSNSQTFSNNLSSASTYTCIKSISASGDSVEVEMMMKYKVA